MGAKGSSAGGHSIEDEGVPVTASTILDFVGAGVTVTDVAGKTTVTIPLVTDTDIKVNVFEAGIQVGAVARALDFTDVNDFLITEDSGNDEIDIAINRNAVNGICGLDASSLVSLAQIANLVDANLGAHTSTKITITAKGQLNSELVYDDQVNSFGAGLLQTFQADATNAGLRLTPFAGDPTARANGDVWINDTSNTIFARVNGVDVDLGAGAGGGEANLLASLGGGTALTAGVPKSGVTLQTVSIATTAPLTHSVTTDLLTFDINDLVDADISGSANISQSKLNLDITNTEINASAGILQSKLATLVITDAEISAHTSTKITITTKGQLNSNIVYTDQLNVFGNFDQTFKDNRILIESPDGLTPITIINLQQTLARNLTIPILTANRNILVSGEGNIVDADLSAGTFANITGVGTIGAGTWEGTDIANAFIANLPALGTLPASPRQLAIVDSEVDTNANISLSKLENATDSQFVRGTGTGCVAEAIEISKGGTFLDPDVRNVIVWRAPFPCTVTNVRAYRVGGTGATINARKNGTLNHLSSALSLTSADTWQDGGAVSNTAYVAGDKLEIMFVTLAGTPTQVAIQVDYTRP